jgi:hypothetical protein
MTTARAVAVLLIVPGEHLPLQAGEERLGGGVEAPISVKRLAR